jgi:phosphatidylglycerophosphate synthase
MFGVLVLAFVGLALFGGWLVGVEHVEKVYFFRTWMGKLFAIVGLVGLFTLLANVLLSFLPVPLWLFAPVALGVGAASGYKAVNPLSMIFARRHSKSMEDSTQLKG